MATFSNFDGGHVVDLRTESDEGALAKTGTPVVLHALCSGYTPTMPVNRTRFVLVDIVDNPAPPGIALLNEALYFQDPNSTGGQIHLLLSPVSKATNTAVAIIFGSSSVLRPAENCVSLLSVSYRDLLAPIHKWTWVARQGGLPANQDMYVSLVASDLLYDDTPQIDQVRFASSAWSQFAIGLKAGECPPIRFNLQRDAIHIVTITPSDADKELWTSKYDFELAIKDQPDAITDVASISGQVQV